MSSVQVVYERNGELRPAFGLSVKRSPFVPLVSSATVCTDTFGRFHVPWTSSLAIDRPGLASVMRSSSPGQIVLKLGELDPGYEQLRTRLASDTSGPFATFNAQCAYFCSGFLGYPRVSQRIWRRPSPTPSSWMFTDNPLIFLGTILFAVATDLRFARLAQDQARAASARIVFDATLKRILHAEEAPGYFTRWNQHGTWNEDLTTTPQFGKWTASKPPKKIDFYDTYLDDWVNVFNEPSQDEYSGLVCGLAWAAQLLRGLSDGDPDWGWLEPRATQCTEVLARIAAYLRARGFTLDRPCLFPTFTSRGASAQLLSYGLEAAFHHASTQEQRPWAVARLPPLGIASPAAVTCSFFRWLHIQQSPYELVRKQYDGSYWQSVGLGATPAALVPKSTYWRLHSALAGASSLAGADKAGWFNYPIYDHAALAGFNDDLVAEQWTVSAARDFSIVHPEFHGFSAGCLVWFGQRLGLSPGPWVDHLEGLFEQCTTEFNAAIQRQLDRDGYVDQWTKFGDSFLIGRSLLALALDLDLSLPWKDVAAELG